MSLNRSDLSQDVLSLLAQGTVIPAHPLALDANRQFDRRRQRALTRYYVDAGAGGLAVGVHTTQFAIRERGLYATVLESAMEDLKPVIEEKSAVIRVEELPSAPVNPRLLSLLFNNLLSNSLKYSSKDEPPMIRIRSDVTQASRSKNNPAENYVRIFVEDNGIGFDQHNAEYIFGMFRRLHHNTEYEGTGIGLALCKKIVEVHNGFISAKSKPGKGATFIVAIPMQISVMPETEKLKGERTRQAGKK